MLFSPVFAQGPQPWGGDCTATRNGIEVATIYGFECVFKNVVSVAVVFAGLAVFAVLVLGGFKYLTAGGDPKAQEQAKNTLTYAIFGLVLIIAAYLILSLVSNFTGITDLLNFNIIRRP